VNSSRHLFWTWQTPLFTYIAHSNNRGSETIDREFPEGFPQSTLVHDGWRAQIKTVSKNHQACFPHLQRILNYLNQLYPKQEWGINFIKLLYDSEKLKKNLEFQNKQYNEGRTLIIQRFEFLLNNPPNQTQKELYTFYKRMLWEKQHVFTFLFIENVPSDNNASERAIRNVKVKQKIS
ncbi:MAG: IS66 family transposase, partial [Bacteroidota bacterium]